MSSYRLCRVCNNPANIEYSVFRTEQNYHKGPKFYCSKNCYYYDDRGTRSIIGILFIGTGIAVISAGSTAGGAIVIVIGLVYLLIALSSSNPNSLDPSSSRKTVRVRRSNLKRKRQPKKQTLTPIPLIEVKDGELMYSEILDSDVRPCCYQTARLNDKYCSCGRALEYPSQT